jgi:hypothetical protein
VRLRYLLYSFLAFPQGDATDNLPRSFAVGERAEYDVKYGIVHAGRASLSVVGIDTVRGKDAYHFRLTISGGVNLLLYRYSLRDTIESWVDTTSFNSLRFVQDQLQRGKARMKHYEIFPERAVYEERGKEEQPSVSNPLDDISLLYYVRKQPLRVGSQTEIPRHFKPANNPIILNVIGRDTIEAVGRKWSTIIVQPIIKTSTMFADGDGRVWLSDDADRVIVQINAKISVGSITMKLRKYQTSMTARPVTKEDDDGN